MSEFLETVQRASPLADHDRALEAVRGVFYALLRGAGNGQVREAADHLPDDLETLWKPALFICLREDEASDPSGPETFVERVRRQVPDLDGEAVRRVARAVLRELRSRVSAEGRSELARGIPDELRDDWTG